MEILQALKSRRSCRDFSPEQINHNILPQIIEIARFAPTARNIQPWHFVIITENELMEAIHSLIQKNAPFFKQAKACIAVFCQDVKYYLEDGSAVTTYILLAAEAFGLGACWIAGDKKEYCQQICSLLFAPAEYRLVSLVALGYGNIKPLQPPKKNVQDLVSWQRFTVTG